MVASAAYRVEEVVMRSPMQVLRDRKLPPEQRREAKEKRDAVQHAREAERLAARTEAEARRHGDPYGGYSGR